MKKVDFDNYTDGYNQMLHQGTRFFTANEAYFAKYKVETVRERVAEEPRRVLEFGCGIGGNIPYLRQAFGSAEIMGSDISTKSLEIARIRNPDIYFWQEGEGDTAQGDFDLIFVAGVFHHVPTPERVAVAKLMFSRLKPGGLIFVFEHNPYNPVTQKIVSNCPYDEDAVLLKPSELNGLLREGGLEIKEQQFSLFFPQWLKLALPLERYLGWLPLGGQYWIKARRPLEI
ncbi:MAG TPA: class I SAM-dependent methyltransferase [Candidatus Competibacter sp.]|nr:class I SAM-dependent methyltransferase [Candidatus Competibacter sp.]